MNDARLTAMLVCIGIITLACLRKVALHFTARRVIYRALKHDCATITRIRPFNGFLDLGSVFAALTNTGYIVNVVANGGDKSELFCLVRYIPVLGIARSVEILFDRSKSA